jgi:hypothetical protein
MNLDENAKLPDKAFFVGQLFFNHCIASFLLKVGRSQGKPFLNLGRGNKLVSRTTYPLKPLINIPKSKKNA